MDVKHAEESSEASATPPEPPPRGSEPVGLKPALPQIGFELVLEGSAQSSSPQTDELALRAEDVEVRDKATEAEAHAKLLEVQAEAEAALRAKDSVIELEGELLRKEFELRDAVRRRESGSTSISRQSQFGGLTRSCPCVISSGCHDTTSGYTSYLSSYLLYEPCGGASSAAVRPGWRSAVSLDGIMSATHTIG